jgi:hypothetical protein
MLPPVTEQPPFGNSVTPSHALRRDAKCLVALAGMRIALSLAGYNAIRQRMPQAQPSPDAHFYARQLARRIERLARIVPGASCLTQALALQWLLARAGHGCELLVGVRRDEAGHFAAHAWVACNERIVLGAAGTRIDDFTELARAR